MQTIIVSLLIFSYDLVRDEIRTFTENKISPYKSSIFQNSLRKLDQKVKFLNSTVNFNLNLRLKLKVARCFL